MQGGAPVKSLGDDKHRNSHDLIAQSFYGEDALQRAQHGTSTANTNDPRTTLAIHPQDKEAESVNELQRENGAKQTRPTGRRWRGGGGLLRHGRSRCRCGAEPSKAVGVAGEWWRCRRWVAKRGGLHRHHSRAAWVGRWLRRVVGRMSCDSGVGEGGWPLALLMPQRGRRLGALRPEHLLRR